MEYINVIIVAIVGGGGCGIIFLLRWWWFFPLFCCFKRCMAMPVFFFNVAAKTKMFTEMNVTLRTLLVRPHGCFWFCFLFYGSTWLVSYMTSVSQTLQPSALALMKTEVVCTSCPCQSLKHTNAGGPSQRPFPYITAWKQQSILLRARCAIMNENLPKLFFFAVAQPDPLERLGEERHL